MDIIEVSESVARELLPKRPENSNKGTFGRLLSFIGSEKYMGAAYLAIEAMLRGGAGYVELFAPASLKYALLPSFPEVIYKDMPKICDLTDADIEFIASEKEKSATLIGCGSGVSENLAKLTLALMEREGAPLVIDADAINSLALFKTDAKDEIRRAKRQIILTPHPLEFSRISKLSIDEISNNRARAAEAFARDTESIVLLKGSGTVITDSKTTYINKSGSSALAKAGSGDCLAGLLSSLVATRLAPSLQLAALSAYIHGAAADNLSASFSKYGVRPKDLPSEMARVIRSLER